MNDRLQRALLGLPVDRPPVWFMRQAGRYLPEYREVRQRATFDQMTRSADLSLEVTLQPVRRFGLDAAIVFSDILVILEALGLPVAYETGEGPQIKEPIRDPATVDRLRTPDVADALPWPNDTIRMFRKEMPDVPILGFGGAPFTLLCYAVEGLGSKEFALAKRFLWDHPAAAQKLLDRLADTVGDHLENQARAGALAVQLFDTWAGVLSPEDYERWALPAATRALSRVKSAKRIYYTKDSAPFLPVLRRTGADVIGLDWRVRIGEARKVLGDVPVQGNLDPIALFAPEAEIRRRVRAILAEGGGTGHIFNLGHGILPGTPVAGVAAMIDEVKQWASVRS